MKIAARFSLIKQHHIELCAMCEPQLVSEVHPKDDQKGRYIELLKQIKIHIDSIETEFKNGVLNEAAVQRDIPRDLLEYYKDKILPSQAAIDKALKTLDPDLANLFYLLAGGLAQNDANGKVKFTFDVAIERMVELVENNPDLENSFSVLRANEILESKLIEFDPDEWLDNASELYPIRTSRNGANIPVQAKQRLVEIYRAYIFGNWLSVLALARSTMEYVILDNLHKFNVSRTYEITKPKPETRPKKLSHLIEEVGEILPDLKVPMEEIREYGNDYIHPKKSKQSKEALFQKKEKAKSCMCHLRQVVEGLYFAVGEKTSNARIRT